MNLRTANCTGSKGSRNCQGQRSSKWGFWVKDVLYNIPVPCHQFSPFTVCCCGCYPFMEHQDFFFFAIFPQFLNFGGPLLLSVQALLWPKLVMAKQLFSLPEPRWVGIFNGRAWMKGESSEKKLPIQKYLDTGGQVHTFHINVKGKITGCCLSVE